MARREVIQIRVSEAEKEKWNDVATAQGMDLSSWIRLLCDRATRPGAGTAQPGAQTSLEAVGVELSTETHQVGRIERPARTDF